ncbi:hypothetical protein [Arthrobacter sp. efr-133-R2A-63]|uniref:hypothetical protein n=1 Tax=Arthrobacter sp. efr-133-R2A-63 TaxID=3040278 RepID=UPI002549D1B4|nr:hypothetical protein [Arthrobacter sp. efr-133-R2A-63]
MDTVVLVGYMTNNCILASAAEARVPRLCYRGHLGCDRCHQHRQERRCCRGQNRARNAVGTP